MVSILSKSHVDEFVILSLVWLGVLARTSHAQPRHKAEVPLMPPKVKPPKITHQAYLDIHVEGDENETDDDKKLGGRIIVGLYGDLHPLTVENFRSLITGERGLGPISGKPLHYKDTVFHRIVPDFMIQGGDVTHNTGVGGESIYGTHFRDENIENTPKFDEPLKLAMANRGGKKHTNNSQFFISTVKTRWLDGFYVIFGKVLHGSSVVYRIESLGSASGVPKRKATIVDCGMMEVEESANAEEEELVEDYSSDDDDGDADEEEEEEE